MDVLIAEYERSNAATEKRQEQYHQRKCHLAHFLTRTT
jgi:hypothetical protein